MRERVLIIFPLANDTVSMGGEWTDIGPNGKCRIDDIMRQLNHVRKNEIKLFVFAAGTDQAHHTGQTLASLGHNYFLSKYDNGQCNCVVNVYDKDVYGTDPEIIWGVTKVLEQYPRNEYELTFVFATQKRHMPRVKKIVRRRFDGLPASFIVTQQTKEIPRYREAISWVKLMLGDGWLAQRVHRLRRRFPDKFDRS